jgi:hypothetical protein
VRYCKNKKLGLKADTGIPVRYCKKKKNWGSRLTLAIPVRYCKKKELGLKADTGDTREVL